MPATQHLRIDAFDGVEICNRIEQARHSPRDERQIGEAAERLSNKLGSDGAGAG